MKCKVNCSDLKKFAKNLENKDDAVDMFMRALLKELGKEFQVRVKKLTPVKSGDLKRGWDISPIEKNGKIYKITIYNATEHNGREYGVYVEYGHRTRNHKGWIKGKFMMTETAKAMDSIAPAYIEREVKRFLREVGL